jgi:AraC-like DNA-binding protein
MLLKDFLPQPEVREFIRMYRIIHFSFDPSSPAPVKAYPPKVEHVLAFYPNDLEQAEYANNHKKPGQLRVSLTGQQTGVIQRQVGHDFLVFQIVFQPGALFRLTGIPSTELADEYLDGELIFSSSLRLVNEQLYHARDYREMLHIGHRFVCTLLRRKIRDSHPIDEVSRYMLHTAQNINLDAMAHDACLGFKQFERKFKERMGVMPKLFNRINRFDRAFCMKNLHPEMDWLSIAVHCGYYDYQHLVRDYKLFTAMSPTAFHEVENKSPEHALGLSEDWYSGMQS